MKSSIMPRKFFSGMFCCQLLPSNSAAIVTVIKSPHLASGHPLLLPSAFPTIMDLLKELGLRISCSKKNELSMAC